MDPDRARHRLPPLTPLPRLTRSRAKSQGSTKIPARRRQRPSPPRSPVRSSAFTRLGKATPPPRLQAPPNRLKAELHTKPQRLQVSPTTSGVPRLRGSGKATPPPRLQAPQNRLKAELHTKPPRLQTSPTTSGVPRLRGSGKAPRPPASKPTPPRSAAFMPLQHT